MRIGVVGGGVVGNATAHAFREMGEVRVYDVIPERSTHSLGKVLDCDIVFLCLPTPQKVDSLACDLSAVEQFFTELTRFGKGEVIVNFVLRSTVPIGTTKRLREWYKCPNLCHSPEFLTARTAVEDACNPTRLIIGHPRLDGLQWDGLERLYAKRFPAVPLFTMTSDESEAVKLMQNGFSAVKIAFFNEMRCLADKFGLDWERVMSGLLAGGWINSMHTAVPGPDGQRGFGGPCLPKDLANLVKHVWDNRTDAETVAGTSVCYAALLRNRLIDRKGQA